MFVSGYYLCFKDMDYEKKQASLIRLFEELQSEDEDYRNNDDCELADDQKAVITSWDMIVRHP